LRNPKPSFEAILAQCISARDHAQWERVEAIMSKHQEYADEIRDFFAETSSLVKKIHEVSAGCSEQQPAPPLHESIRFFGDYELIELLGSGAMGEIYRAHHRTLDRIVALKVIRGAQSWNETFIERFRIEAQLSAKLIHPNIVRIYDVGEVDGRMFYTMDCVDGFNLKQLAVGVGLDGVDAARIISKIARATYYAHNQGVIHRDIKPSNILIDKSTHQPAITDFGLAKNLLDPSDLTLSNEVVGSPAYLAPETIGGGRLAINPLGDIYSLGATLYHLLAGKPPISGSSVADTLHLASRGEIVAIRELVPRVPKDLETICMKCMELDPKRRYATAELLAEDLERYLTNEPILARPLGPIGQFYRWGCRKPAQAIMLAVGMCVLVTAVLTTLYVNRLRHAAETKRIEAEQSVAETTELADYLVDILRSPDPAINGREVTVASRLEAAVVQANDQLESQPRRRAAVLAALGRSFHGLGMAAPAEETLRQAIDCFASQVDPNHPELIIMRTHLADITMAANPAAAITTLSNLQNLWRSNYDVDTKQYFFITSSLAAAYQSESRFPEALHAFQEVANRSKSLFGDEAPETLMALREYANAQLDVSDLTGALETYEFVLQSLRQQENASPLETIRTLAGIGETYRAMKEVLKATAVHEEALQKSLELLGADHPETLQRMQNLAFTYMHSGPKKEDAADLLRRRQQLTLAKYGPDHRQSIEALASLGTALYVTQKHAEAIPSFRAVLPQLLEHFGPLDQQTLAIQQQLAVTLDSVGEHEEAESIFRTILPNLREVFGERGLNVLATESQLAKNLASQRRYVEAAECFESLIEPTTALLGTAHKKPNSHCFQALSNFYLARDYDRALTVGRRFLDTYCESPAANPDNNAIARIHIADCLRRNGELSPALAVLSKAMTRLEPLADHLGAQAAAIRGAIAMDQGETETARFWLTKATTGFANLSVEEPAPWLAARIEQAEAWAKAVGIDAVAAPSSTESESNATRTVQQSPDQ
jgi:tetratricopeptide (TPR) repeat protein/tRNA A-37 threonylcarbamoyl transferase component Bud32